MSNWRIPPVGWCAVCLVLPDEEALEGERPYRERPAMTLWRGTALCREHLLEVVNNGYDPVALLRRA